MLSQRGVVLIKDNFSDGKIKLIKSELTVEPFIQKEYQFNVKKYNIYMENDKKLYIPRFYAVENNIPFSFERMPVKKQRPRLKFTGGLRPLQEEAKSAFLKANEEVGGGIISLATGQGKTVVALNIVCELGVKTLILVHQSFLMNQWKERIEQFVPKARIGIIQQDIFQIADKDIIIAMIQTVCKRNFTIEQRAQLKEVGFLITDEAHHISSEHFNRALFKVGARSILGLTATPRRKDKLERVFQWHLGKVVFTPPAGQRRAGLQPIVNSVKYHGEGKDFQEQRNQAQQISIPMMLSKIVKNKERNMFVVEQIQKMVNEPGRHILVLSDRRAHLQVMQRMLSLKYPITTTGFYIGGMKQEELKESETKQVLFATYSMVSEAFDLPSLNTLFLTTARSDIEQSVGRILRKAHVEVAPMIIDITDQFSIFFAQGRKRISFYRSKGYKIIFSSNKKNQSVDQNIDQDVDEFESPKKRQKIDNLKTIFQDD